MNESNIADGGFTSISLKGELQFQSLEPFLLKKF
jgi:hypothetical protein